MLNIGDVVAVDIAALNVANKANFTLVDTVQVDEFGAVEALFRNSVGDPEYPMSLRVGIYPKPAALNGVGLTNVSVKLTTYYRKTDDVTELTTWTHPGNVTIAFSTPGQLSVPDNEDMVSLLGSAFSWLVPIVSGVVATSALAKIKFGIASDLDGLVNSGS
jgi:hypothetical protein